MANRDSPIVWRQAVQFDQLGGWTADSQFIDQMGFTYLLATGLGVPVDDAVAVLDVPRTDDYRLWVRCKDWFPAHSPGRFLVLVDGRLAAVEFGQASDDRWQWRDGGQFVLSRGAVDVRLRDATGWWGRCDAVVLSADPAFRPSDDLDELWRQRIVHGAVSADVDAPTPHDVVVVGGGLAGAAAAVAAARHGCRVALIHDRPVLGGNTSSEIQVPALGDETREPWDPGETGIVEEFDPKATGRGGWSANVRAVVDAEPNIDLRLNHRSTSVEVSDDATIRSVEAIDTTTGRRCRFRGRVFVDCTGDAALGAAAGADFRQGREAAHEFDETLAPPDADLRTMGSTLFGGRIDRSEGPTSFDTPAWAHQWKRPEDFEQRSTAGVWSTGKLPPHFLSTDRGAGRPPESAAGPVGCWFAEWGGMQDTIEDAEAIRDELFRICVGIWGYVKNHDPVYREANRDRRLAWLNHIAGKRESRRLVGDYVLSQRDYSEHIVHDDTVAYGGWTIDDHHPQGYFTPGPSAYHAFLHKVSIPYRSLYSRNVGNLMMAGRNLSATHVGFAGVRVMRTCCQMGQAVGTAAAIAVREQTSPRGVYESHMGELQQSLLKDGAYLLGVENRDPHDVARRATISASSVASGRNPDWVVTPTSKWGTVHRLDTTRAVMFRAAHDRVERVALLLRSRRSDPATTLLTLGRADDLGDFNSGRPVARTEVAVPDGYHGWVDVELRAELHSGDYYCLELAPCTGLEWELYSYHPPETLRGYDGPKWGALWGCYKFCLTPGGEPPASAYAAAHDRYVFAPENIANGRNRAVAGDPCSWAPAPELALPQHVQLDFQTPIRCDTLHVTFQLASLAPAAYRVEARINGRWTTVVRVDDNHARRRVHAFDTIELDGLRLVFERPPRQPGPLTPVCEIRLYDESANAARKGDA